METENVNRMCLNQNSFPVGIRTIKNGDYENWTVQQASWSLEVMQYYYSTVLAVIYDNLSDAL